MSTKRFEHFATLVQICSRCCRSPSPEPIYSGDGKRLNTREYRKRKELEDIRFEALHFLSQIHKYTNTVIRYYSQARQHPEDDADQPRLQSPS